MAHPLCAECERHGIIAASLGVRRAQGGDMYDECNMQVLCQSCNIAKGKQG